MKTKTENKKQAAPAQIIHPNQQLVPVDAVGAATRQVASIMQRAVENPKLDVRKMREIMDMQMEVLRYQAEISFNLALNACQQKIPHISPNRKNTHTKSNYADLEAIDKIIRPIISRHGFSLSFNTEQVPPKHIKVICTVRHIEGHKVDFSMVGELDDGGFKGTANKTGIQAAGSSASYLERYLIKLIFYVIVEGEDTDGNKQKPATTEGQQFTSKMQAERKPGIKEQAAEMKRDLISYKTRAKRLALVNANLAFLKQMDEAGMEAEVQELHDLVDQGEGE